MRNGFPELGATALQIFEFLAARLRRGERGALVTMTAREGSSVRSLGSHMAVLEGGSYAGSFSGGCIEAAIVGEGQEAIRAGTPRIVRYGKGSSFIDIRLPCGGGVDLLFQPDPPLQQIERAAALLRGRSPATLALAADQPLTVEDGWHSAPTGWSNGHFKVRHPPPLRLLVAGQGGESLAMVKLARAYGADTLLLSPDEQIVAAGQAEGAEARQLWSAASPPDLDADSWTALVLLFHSHEWESALLEQGLATPVFWIGAMGSQRTHAARLEALAERGISAEQRSRVRGPIGLIPATRDPATMALSALSEIVGEYQRLIQ